MCDIASPSYLTVLFTEALSAVALKCNSAYVSGTVMSHTTGLSCAQGSSIVPSCCSKLTDSFTAGICVCLIARQKMSFMWWLRLLKPWKNDTQVSIALSQVQDRDTGFNWVGYLPDMVCLQTLPAPPRLADWSAGKQSREVWSLIWILYKQGYLPSKGE